jgi:hypothetical protein
VGAEIVHNDDIAGLQCRHQHLLDIGEEALAIDRPVNDAGRGDAVMPECRKEGHCTPMAVRDLSPKREPTSPPAMGTGHVGLCPRLIDEDETGRIDFKLVPLPPGAAAGDIQADPARSRTRFFLKLVPWRLRNRQSVSDDTTTPRSPSSANNA